MILPDHRFLSDQTTASQTGFKRIGIGRRQKRPHGLDKGAVNWYGKEQRYHMADLLKKHLRGLYFLPGCRAAERGQYVEYLSLPIPLPASGPYGAILSAFREQPDSGVAGYCLRPAFGRCNVLQHLVDNRNTATIATAYQSDYKDFPEPLITIYEPKSYPTLLQYLAQGILVRGRCLSIAI
jgi:molybdopterin-guanine dinucleotide biosynthesis protein A